jgi:hypothetical protein
MDGGASNGNSSPSCLDIKQRGDVKVKPFDLSSGAGLRSYSNLEAKQKSEYNDENGPTVCRELREDAVARGRTEGFRPGSTPKLTLVRFEARGRKRHFFGDTPAKLVPCLRDVPAG